MCDCNNCHRSRNASTSGLCGLGNWPASAVTIPPVLASLGTRTRQPFRRRTRQGRGDAQAAQIAALTEAVTQCQNADQVYALIKANAASRVQNLPPPATVISDPPTQSQVADIEDYLGQLYSALIEP